MIILNKNRAQLSCNLINILFDSLCSWYKLVDKNGKQEKDRGEVLLDIQFMRNNLTASMFDLSMTDKPRSGLGKLKDKIRGKKKDGLSDSASAIVPSSVGTDSEGEGGSDNPKKKSKLKSLFGPKTNLQRNVSQSMSTLGTLPEKNSSLSSSRSSGLNVDSPDGKVIGRFHYPLLLFPLSCKKKRVQVFKPQFIHTSYIYLNQFKTLISNYFSFIKIICCSTNRPMHY